MSNFVDMFNTRETEHSKEFSQNNQISTRIIFCGRLNKADSVTCKSMSTGLIV